VSRWPARPRWLLAGGQGDDLVHLLLDAAGFVDDGEGEVQPLQALGDRGEDLERPPPRRHGKGVGVHLDAALQIRVELHHPGRLPVAEGGLAFVGGDDDDAGPFLAG
jgi:hypothetical protein